MNNEIFRERDETNLLTPIEQNIRDSYLAFRQTADLADREIGSITNFLDFDSTVNRRCTFKIRQLFHTWIDDHKDQLPESIPLFKEKPEEKIPRVEIRAMGVSLSIVSFPHRDYFLPRKQILYTYRPLPGGIFGVIRDDEREGDPESPKFIGFEKILSDKSSSFFYVFSPIDYKNENSPRQLSDYQLSIVLESLTNFFVDNKELTERLGTLKQGVDELKQEANSTIEELIKNMLLS